MILLLLLLTLPTLITGSVAIPTCTHLCIYDPLDAQSAYQWDDNIQDSSGTCGFMEGTYEMTAYATNPNGGTDNAQICFARNPMLTNCRYEVQMQIHQGVGGLVFGNDDPPSKSKENYLYYFWVEADGHYGFDYGDITGLIPGENHNREGDFTELDEGWGDAISNSQQKITLTMQVSSPQVYLFINGMQVMNEKIGGTKTPPISIGYMGLGAGDYAFTQDSDVTFSNVRVLE